MEPKTTTTSCTCGPEGPYRQRAGPGLSDVCAACGVELEDVEEIEARRLRAAVAEALLTLQGGAGSVGSGRPHSAIAEPIVPGVFYTLRESAARLRLDRSGTLRRAIEAGHVRAVKVGKAARITGEEILRVLREGLPALPDERRPPAPRRTRRARKARPANGSISKIPL